MQLDPKDRISRVDAGNPYRPSATSSASSSAVASAVASATPEPSQSDAKPSERLAARSLRYIAHGVYLQIFLGVGFLLLAATGVDLTRLLAGPHVVGGLLIMLGINSLIYIHRYKKSLRQAD
ncbi:hypothetical protein [Rubripirellula reticaptiva]|nr:hypothetical protein [Rubripirellula reticaptiva]